MDDANQDLADMQAFMFGSMDDCYSDVVTNVDYAGLPQFKAKKPIHYNQDRYFYEMMEQTTPKDKKDTVTFRQMTLLMIMGSPRYESRRMINQMPEYKYRLNGMKMVEWVLRRSILQRRET